ncbi:hypothetical protein MCAP1_002525 [Malassezia caprae]|uniref:Uncharacterized protein n=1 Tax=Malassezia caprae TaxID=1381934 RepID=A0AAF0ECH7_9BASI|nr:hypothetical protein MCAP1_002525 [Malassezia caprae]
MPSRTCAVTRACAWSVAGRWGARTTHGRLCALPTPWCGTVAAASVSHAVLVDGDQVLAAGQNGAGQLGTRPCAEHWHIAAWQAPEPIQHVAAGMGFSVLGAAHALYACGTNVRGQRGGGSPLGHGLVRLPWRGAAVEGIAAGLDHALVLAREAHGAQSVYAWGLNTDGQVGDPGAGTWTPVLRRAAIPLVPQERLVRVVAGGDTSAVLTDHGRLFVWGNTEYGQALQPDDTADQQTVPLLATALPPHVCDVQLGGSFVLLLDGVNTLTTDNGTLHVAGYGATGHADTVRTPVPLPLGERVVRIHAGLHYAAAITESGDLYTWGLDTPDGRLAHGPLADRRVVRPRRVTAAAGAADVICGGASLLVRHTAA